MAEKTNEATPKEKPKLNKLWIVVTALALVLAGDLGWRAFSLFRTPKAAAAAGAGEQASKGVKEAATEMQKPERVEVKATLPLEPFLVNLADKDTICYLKATFQLGMSEANEEIGNDKVALAAARDAIISLLSSKSSEQILTIEGKDKLREEIRKRVNAVLPKGKVQEVYIVDFVVSQ